MKKLLFLSLALLMVLSVGVPALAFTPDAYEDDPEETPFDLSIVLVDYEEGYVSKHVLSLPPTDRGYLRNSVICALVSLYMPEEEFINTDHDYTTLKFGGENVDLNVTDNNPFRENNNANNDYLFELYTNLPGIANSVVRGEYSPHDNEISINLTTALPGARFEAANAHRDFTVNIAFFGKVTADDGLVYTELNKHSNFIRWPLASSDFYPSFPLDGDDALGEGFIIIGDYIVVKDTWENPSTYYIFSYDDGAFDTLLFSIKVDSRDRTTEAVFYDLIDDIDPVTAGNQPGNPLQLDDYTAHEVTVNFRDDVLFAKGNIWLDGGGESKDKQLYRDLLDIYEDDFVDEFGFDYSAIGNVLKDDFFQTRNRVGDLYDEVSVQPFEQDLVIVIPDPIDVVQDPPKVG